MAGPSEQVDLQSKPRTPGKNRRLLIHGAVLSTVIVATLLAAWPGSRAIIQGNLVAEAPSSPPEQVSAQTFRAGYLRALPLIGTEAGLLPIDALATNASPRGFTVEEAMSGGEAEKAEAAAATSEPEAPYFSYIVQQGDTVAAIAQRYGLEIESILWNNPDVNNHPDMLLIGQELVIPSRDGILYTLKLGDTLLDIAGIYQVEVADIIGFSSNEISDPDSVREGALVLLPGAVPPPPPPPAATPEAIFVTDTSEGTAPAGDFTPAAAPTVSGFIWPAVGSISDYYGAPRGGGTYHTGLDIDLYGRYGAPIVAAAPGQVVLASFGGYGYGYHVVIRHDNGYETLYAHLSDIYVTEGQWVSQGETIGAAGCTGYCTGTHLHFEVKQDGASLDPLDYLP